MKLFLALVVVFVGIAAGRATPSSPAADDEQDLLQVDRALFRSSPGLKSDLLDENFTWTDSRGNTQSLAQLLKAFRAGKLEWETSEGGSKATNAQATVTAHVYGQVGIVQENSGDLYTLRIWVKRPAGWRALVFQEVATGAPALAEPGGAECKNPCEGVPFQPQNEDERNVIRAYQDVERAVAAHNSSAWGAHIANEFFAVTSNSNRPLDKATRMAGLDSQKVAGIAPFPLVSARMLPFGDAMIMISRQQPENGRPLHVTRVWFKRNGAWLEAYSYQTTILPGLEAR